MQDIKETLLNITKNVTKTSGDILKTTKLNINLTNEETNLRNMYIEIGKKVHEIYRYGGSLGKAFDEKYLEIDACERRISDLREQISLVKGTKACVKCGKTVERIAEFCPKCGTRLDVPAAASQEEFLPIPEIIPEIPQEIPQEIPPPQIAEPIQQLRRCRICGSENEISAKFCLSCGRITD